MGSGLGPGLRPTNRRKRPYLDRKKINDLAPVGLEHWNHTCSPGCLHPTQDTHKDKPTRTTRSHPPHPPPVHRAVDTDNTAPPPPPPLPGRPRPPLHMQHSRARTLTLSHHSHSVFIKPPCRTLMTGGGRFDSGRFVLHAHVVVCQRDLPCLNHAPHAPSRYKGMHRQSVKYPSRERCTQRQVCGEGDASTQLAPRTFV